MTEDEFRKRTREIGMEWALSQYKLAEKQQFKCAYCGRRLLDTYDDYHAWEVDHVIPTIEDRDNEENLVVACNTCNFIKHRWIPAGWQDLSPAERVALARAEVKRRREERTERLTRLKEFFLEYEKQRQI
ncbi:HNH endonuclease [bacterium]|nr:HNH endonuclease [bacterium]